MCTSPKEISPVCGSQTQRPPTLVGITLRKLPWSSCLHPLHSHTPPTPFLLVFATGGPSWESLSCHHVLPDRCGLPVSPDRTGSALVPCFSGARSNAWRKVGAQQLFVTWCSPPLLKPTLSPLPSPTLCGPHRCSACAADACLLLPT